MRSFSIGDIVALCLLVASGSAAEVDGPPLGKAAPALSFSQVLHAPPGSGTTWEALRGQVVVLDFWATWCGPCRKALPHWNELVDAFKDKPVRFIAVTDENQQVVENFLKQTPIHSWVGLDGAGRSNLEAYNIHGIPTTVIANKEGVVVAVIHPAKLEPNDIDEVLRTGQSSLSPAEHRARLRRTGNA